MARLRAQRELLHKDELAREELARRREEAKGKTKKKAANPVGAVGVGVGAGAAVADTGVTGPAMDVDDTALGTIRQESDLVSDLSDTELRPIYGGGDDDFDLGDDDEEDDEASFGRRKPFIGRRRPDSDDEGLPS